MKIDEQSTGEFGPPRILVVDDEPSIRDVLIDFLELEGYLVSAVANGEEALACLDEVCPEVALVDLEMPGMNGVEVLRQIAAISPRTLTVMMTGYGTVETAINAMKAGAYDYVLKPFKVPEIIRLVERGLEKRRLEAENVELKELVDLYDASERVNARLTQEHIFDVLVDTVGSRSSADAVGLWVCDDQGDELTDFERARRWVDADAPAKAGPLLDRVVTKGLLAEWGRRGAQILDAGDCPAAADDELVSLLSIPLRSDDRIFGVIFALRVPPSRPFRESKRKLLSILTDRASAAIENSLLYEDLQQTFKQTIQALANILEDKDPYTRGHSERVSQIARMIAEGMGLPEKTVNRIADSALMHDIGKLGIRFEELNKADPLTEAEYEMFKSHTTRGKWILEPIEFLHPLIPGVYHHHERWDGRGYPQGLKREETPLMARILAVADTYDAMTSHRAYRRALSHEIAMREIEDCAGSQFDPDVVAVFLREMKRHRSGQLSRAARWRSLADTG